MPRTKLDDVAPVLATEIFMHQDFVNEFITKQCGNKINIFDHFFCPRPPKISGDDDDTIYVMFYPTTGRLLPPQNSFVLLYRWFVMQSATILFNKDVPTISNS
jgi:hypothetical protein